MQVKLTERVIKNISPKKTPYEVVDSETPEFLLRVQPSGVLTYYLVYRTQEGIKKRYRLGRHGSITFASRLVMAGVDLNTTRELLGHANLLVTLRYAHLATGHKAEAVSRLVNFKGS